MDGERGSHASKGLNRIFETGDGFTTDKTITVRQFGRSAKISLSKKSVSISSLCLDGKHLEKWKRIKAFDESYRQITVPLGPSSRVSCQALPGFPKRKIPDLMKWELKRYPHPSLPDELVEHIMQLLPKKHRRLWFKCIEDLVKELKDDYMNISKYIKKLSILECEKEEERKPESYVPQSHLDRIKLEPEEVRSGMKTASLYKSLYGQIFCFHDLTIHIIGQALEQLPQTFVNFFTISKFNSYHHPSVITAFIKKEIELADAGMSIMWFTPLFLKITEPEFFIKFSYDEKIRFASLISQLIKGIILERIYNTVDHVVNFLTNPETTPRIEITPYYSQSGEIVLSPSCADVYLCYTDVIQKITGMAENLTNFEHFVKSDLTSVYIDIKRYDNIIEKYIEKVATATRAMYEPIINYYLQIEKEYGQLMDDEPTAISNLEVLSLEGLMDFGDHYMQFQKQLKNISENIFINNFKVNNRPLLKALIHLCNYRIKLLMCEVIRAYTDSCTCILNEFTTAAQCALNIPAISEGLIALRKYMTWVSTHFMDGMRIKVLRILRIFSRMMEFINPGKSYLHMTGKILGWIDHMSWVIEENDLLTKGTKLQLEEQLQLKTNKLNEDLEWFVSEELDGFNCMDNYKKLEEYAEHVIQMIRHVEDFDERVQWINKEETLHQMSISTYPELDEIKSLIYPFAKLIFALNKWHTLYIKLMDGSLKNISIELVEGTLNIQFKKISEIQNQYKIKIRIQAAENYPRRFLGNVDDTDVANWPVPTKLCQYALQEIKEMKQNITLISVVCNDSMTYRHWKQISEIAGRDMAPTSGSSLRDYLEFKLDDKMEQIEAVSFRALKEFQLHTNLALMKNEWNNIQFSLTSSSIHPALKILSSVDEIQSVLDNQTAKLFNMRGSTYFKAVQGELNDWYFRLELVRVTMEEWGELQKKWLYFFPIFSAKDIAVQIPEEAKLFLEVDEMYRNIIRNIEMDPLVIHLSDNNNFLNSFKICFENMEKVSVGTVHYLNKKRLFFPRFFFLSNDELLKILSETKDPQKIQPYLNTFFQGIEKLSFDSLNNVYGIRSATGEEISLTNKISISATGGSVEKWIIQIEDQMFISMRRVINECLQNYERNIFFKTDWIQMWPEQVLICVFLVNWTLEVHSCLKSRKSKCFSSYAHSLSKQLDHFIALIRKSPPMRMRTTLEALVMQGVHCKDATYELWNENIFSENDFLWLSQLRYYWSNDLQLRIMNFSVNFGYEYLGNQNRIVVTPVTERCYRTLIATFCLHSSGAPQGLPGTGKTHTIKDLAVAIAVHCIVFNCTHSTDYLAVAKLFKGVSSSGAWACLEAVDQLGLSVLSMVAQQILTIQQAVKNQLTIFTFEGTTLTLNPSCFITVTLSLEGTARTQLPGNLKILLRPVAMMVPDFARICEVTLLSYGFLQARQLSVKLVTIRQLCAQLISPQTYHGYDLHPLQTVLLTAGKLKRKFPEEEEDVLLYRSFMDVYYSQFRKSDNLLFSNIVSDVFPKKYFPQDEILEVMLPCIQEVCAKRNLQPTEYFVQKVLQTYKMMIARHSFLLIGEPCSGKSTCLHVLADTLNLMNEKHKIENTIFYETINPKSVMLGQLYGQMDARTGEWIDGLATYYFRSLATLHNTERTWLIFDGPLDLLWIENMNTVLDNNKKLCLDSGEVINMSSNMSVILEVMDLAEASPATVSRCGIVYMETKQLDWRSLGKSWTNKVPKQWIEDYPNRIISLFNWIISPCLDFVTSGGKQIYNVGNSNAVWTTCQIVEMMLLDALKDQDLKYFVTWLHASTILSIEWGIAGTLEENAREQFDAFLKTLWKGENREHPIPQELEPLEISIPDEGLLQDYTYCFKSKGMWKYWPEVVKSLKIEESSNPQSMLVSTVETVKYMALMSLHVKFKKLFVLLGPSATGKTMYMRNFLLTQTSFTDLDPAFLTFTSTISAGSTQKLILSTLVKRGKGVFGPSLGKTCVMFLDDLNMPTKEKYGAQPPLELLRQFFDHRYWYDLKTKEKIFLEDIFFIGAMRLQRGNKCNICARFLRHFSLYSMNTFSDEVKTKIFITVLSMGFKKIGLPADIVNLSQQIVAATLNLYSGVFRNLLPSPDRCHYLFNFRDVIRVIHSHLWIKKDSVEGKKAIIRLWIHEVLRVFFDRLIYEADQIWLFDRIKHSVNEVFQENLGVLLDDLNESEQTEVSLSSLHNLIFTHAMDSETEDHKYEEISSMNTFYEAMHKHLAEYNASTKNKMELILFRYALQHLSRILRILGTSGGSAVLVGITGSGRHSLVKFAAFISGQLLIQPDVTEKYELMEWRNDIKHALKETGGHNKDVVFLFDFEKTKNDEFLYDIDSVLNTGEVPDVYTLDEKQELMEMVRLDAQGGNRDLDITPLLVFTFFVNRCKQKLHIIICFSPLGPDFRKKVMQYPSLVNNCYIDWFEGWPEDALEKIAHTYLLDLEIELKKQIVVASQYFHVSARLASEEFYTLNERMSYIPSICFIDFMKKYQTYVKNDLKNLYETKCRYVCGLEKLEFAESQVSIMENELEELQPKLKVAAEETSAMLEMIEKETEEVEKASDRVRHDEEIANVQAVSSMQLKTECENDLALAIPILEDAVAALNTLKPTDITLVKAMKNPPEAVKRVMAAVCIMKGVKADRIPDPKNPGRKMMDYWGPSKRILGDMTFLQQLKDYDKDNIPQSIMDSLRKQYISQKDFNPKVVAKASSAAEGLCKWIIALDKYDIVVKEVAPKKEKLLIAEQEYAETLRILEEKRNMLKALEEKLAKLNQNLVEANERKVKLLAEVESCLKKLDKAKKIIGSLGGEKTRWRQQALKLQEKYDTVYGDVLISCGVIGYLAPFTSVFRSKIIDDWRSLCIEIKIPLSEKYSFIEVFGSDIEIQQWGLFSLPNDKFSIENAIIVSNSEKWPLLVDPQGLALNWVKKMESENSLKVIKYSQGFSKIFESALRFGNPVLFYDIEEELNSFLDPILLRHTFMEDNRTFVNVSKIKLEYNPNFRLYITTKRSKPHYTPRVFRMLTVINFELTQEALSDYFLRTVVATKWANHQEKSKSLIKESARNRIELNQAEDSILKTLSSVQGNILEDEDSVNTLAKSKALSLTIEEKQKTNNEICEKMEKFRLNYKPMAEDAALLFNTLTDLPRINRMYQFSLDWYTSIYVKSIESRAKTNEIESKIKGVNNLFTYNLFLCVCQSLFEKDKLIYSFILCSTLLMKQNLMTKKEMDFFLTQDVRSRNYANKRPNTTDWLADETWHEINGLSELPGFEDFPEGFTTDIISWRYFSYHPKPDLDDLPKTWKSKKDFHKLIIFKILRPDQISGVTVDFIAKEMGTPFVQFGHFDISSAFTSSDCRTPLMFIVSDGADPMMSLISYAQKHEKGDKFRTTSIGQDNDSRVRSLIELSQKDGGWVCLQNCHLDGAWLRGLEEICEGFDVKSTNPDFRLWITTQSSDNYPISLLEKCVKISYENPSGLKNTLLRSFTSEPVCDSSFYMSCPGKDATFIKLLFGVTFFHSVVLERSKFGPMGWNIPYIFDESDYLFSVKHLQSFLQEYEDIPFKALLYMIGECYYGGKITDIWDMRTLNNLLTQYVNERIIFDPEYSLHEEDKFYSIPHRIDHDGFLKFIEMLPSSTSSVVIGLHDNADIKRNLWNSEYFLYNMLLTWKVPPKEHHEISESLIPNIIEEILSKIPKPFDLKIAMEKYPASYNNPLNAILIQEMENFNKLHLIIISTLTELKKAIHGNILMTSDLECIFKDISKSRIPEKWSKVSYPSLKLLGSYIDDFSERINFIQIWFEEGLPINCWISGLYFIPAFLIGVKQDYSRKKVVNIENLTFDYQILKIDKADKCPENGIYVYGLFLNGAKWDREREELAEQTLKVFSDHLPLLWIKPCPADALNTAGRYQCPVFNISDQTSSNNFIISVLLNANTPGHWIRRGVFLLCQLDT